MSTCAYLMLTVVCITFDGRGLFQGKEMPHRVCSHCTDIYSSFMLFHPESKCYRQGYTAISIKNLRALQMPVALLDVSHNLSENIRVYTHKDTHRCAQQSQPFRIFRGTKSNKHPIWATCFSHYVLHDANEYMLGTGM